MTTHSSRRQHWNDIYANKRESEVSWFEAEAALSIDLIQRCLLRVDAKLIDVGGGASRLVDGLLARGYQDVTVLDVSPVALATARDRLGARAEHVHWIAGDITTFEPPTRYALWHDRAVFHFLVSPADRSSYVSALERAVEDGGHAIVGTFALDGPERCSGLDVARYDGPGLAAALGPSFKLVESLRREHITPAGKAQMFTFVRLVRI
jgi:SAM-dependent methyltransferase